MKQIFIKSFLKNSRADSNDDEGGSKRLKNDNHDLNIDEARQISNPKNYGKPWIHKYKPKTLSSFAGNKNGIQSYKIWLLQWKSKKVPEKKVFVIKGPPGSGKTTLANLGAIENKFEIININFAYSDAIQNLSDIIGSSIINFYPSNKKLIIIDNLDTLSLSKATELMKLILSFKKSFYPLVVIITSGSQVSDKISIIEKISNILLIKRPTALAIEKYFFNIFKSEKIEIDLEVIKFLAKKTNNDIRFIISLIESWFLNPERSSLSLLEVKNYYEQHQKSQFKNIFDIIPLLFKEEELKNFSDGSIDKSILDLFFINYDLVPCLIFGNYLNLKSSSSKDPNIDFFKFSAVSNLISKGDFLIKSIRENQNWNFLKIYGINSVLLPIKLLKDYKLNSVVSFYHSSFQTKAPTLITYYFKFNCSSFGFYSDLLPFLVSKIARFIKNKDKKSIISLFNFYNIEPDQFVPFYNLCFNYLKIKRF